MNWHPEMGSCYLGAMVDVVEMRWKSSGRMQRHFDQSSRNQHVKIWTRFRSESAAAAQLLSSSAQPLQLGDPPRMILRHSTHGPGRAPATQVSKGLAPRVDAGEGGPMPKAGERFFSADCMLQTPLCCVLHMPCCCLQSGIVRPENDGSRLDESSNSRLGELASYFFVLFRSRLQFRASLSLRVSCPREKRTANHGD